jgi:hypothetical protein
VRNLEWPIAPDWPIAPAGLVLRAAFGFVSLPPSFLQHVSADSIYHVSRIKVQWNIESFRMPHKRWDLAALFEK